MLPGQERSRKEEAARVQGQRETPVPLVYEPATLVMVLVKQAAVAIPTVLLAAVANPTLLFFFRWRQDIERNHPTTGGFDNRSRIWHGF